VGEENLTPRIQQDLKPHWIKRTEISARSRTNGNSAVAVVGIRVAALVGVSGLRVADPVDFGLSVE
jgi:hypothetical protein